MSAPIANYCFKYYLKFKTNAQIVGGCWSTRADATPATQPVCRGSVVGFRAASIAHSRFISIWWYVLRNTDLQPSVSASFLILG